LFQPLRQELEQDKKKVEIQKVMLAKYKKENGEKGLYSTLKRELYEQRTHMHELEVIDGICACCASLRMTIRANIHTCKDASCLRMYIQMYHMSQKKAVDPRP
jgi:hypothetical protein